MKKVYILFLYTFLLFVPVGFYLLNGFGISRNVYFELMGIMYIANIVSALVVKKERLSYLTIAIFKGLHGIVQISLIIIFVLIGFAGALNPFLYLFVGVTSGIGFVLAVFLNYLILISTSVHSANNLLKDKSNFVNGKEKIHIVLQFILIADIIDTIYLAIISKKNITPVINEPVAEKEDKTMTDDNMQNQVEAKTESTKFEQQPENKNIEHSVVKKKKNKIVLAYVYFTFAIALIVMLIAVSVNMPVINKEMLDRDYVDGLFVMFVAWVSTAGIPLVNLVILAIVSGTTKVAYKIEMIIAIILAVLEVPTFFMALSFVVYF